MDIGRDNHQDFFDKLRSTDGPRNLCEIFDDDNKPLQNETSNLRYQPQSAKPQKHHKHHQDQSHQHQQKHKAKIQSSSVSRSKHHEMMPVESWNTIVGKVAQGYKGTEHVGRVGVALLRNGAGAAKLVVYKSRTNLLCTLLLTKSTQSTSPKGGSSNVIRRGTYLQFYDDEQLFWSLRFEQTKDEEEFMEELVKLGLTINEMRDEKPNKASATPQPLPRHQTSSAVVEPTTVTTNYDSENDSTQSAEEIVTTKTSLVPVAASKSAVSLTVTTMNTAVTSPTSKLEEYLDEQRATGHAIDKKMDTILRAMCRLASNSSLPINEAGDSMSVSAETQDSQNIGSILQAMTRLASSKSRQVVGDSLDVTSGATDHEDDLLELEQKLLNSRKENRSLMKSLKAKERELADLRASTCALCDELLSQNKELKLQNTALASAMSKQGNSGTAVAITTAPSPGETGTCGNCDHYVTKISEMERRMAALQNALLKFAASGHSSNSQED